MNYPSTHKSLLERVQNGDEISWNEFYMRYETIIRFVGSLYQFNDSECDDLIQQVMLKFFQNAKTYIYREGKVKFRTYFASIIKSQAVDLIRSQSKYERLRPGLPGLTEPFEEEFLCAWRKAILDEALDELRQRVDPLTYQAFELYGMQNRPVAEIIQALHMKREQVYLAKSRCTAILKEIIERLNKADEGLNLEL